MPAGLTALLQMVGKVGLCLLDAFTSVFDWAFAVGDGGMLTNWPVLIPIIMMFLVFVKEFVGHIIRGFR